MNTASFKHPSALPKKAAKPGRVPGKPQLRPAKKQDGGAATSGDGPANSSATTKTKTSYSDRLRDQSAQFVIYLLSLIAALSVSNIVQDQMKTLVVWKRVMIAVGIVLFSLAMVTAVAAWVDED